MSLALISHANLVAPTIAQPWVSKRRVVAPCFLDKGMYYMLLYELYKLLQEIWKLP
jgi:hypothetical protein